MAQLQALRAWLACASRVETPRCRREQGSCAVMTVSCSPHMSPTARREYLVESKHLSGHLAAVVEDDAHPPVDLRANISLGTQHSARPRSLSGSVRPQSRDTYITDLEK